MTDDESDGPDPSIRRRQQAQGTAGDLARMGIDPRSLGLGEQPPAPAPSPDRQDQAGDEATNVVQLRPGAPAPAQDLTTPPSPSAPGAPPSQGTSQTTYPNTAPGTAPAGQPAPPTGPTTPAAPFSRSRRGEAPRLLKKMATGMVTPDAAEAIQSERALVDQVRSRQTDRRVVTLVSGKGGVGCTTVALALGTVLMAMRDDRSVLVDVQQGTPSLGAMSGVAAPRNVSSLLTENEVVDPPLAASGLGVVDGADWDQGMRRDDIAGVLELLGHEHTFNLLDAGNDPGDGGHTALARADQVVVVTGPGPMGAAAMRTAHERVREVNQMAVAGVITVVVCQSEDAHRETQRQLRNTPRTVVLPPDPHLAAGRPMDASAVTGATREAMLRVAALVASRTAAHG